MKKNKQIIIVFTTFFLLFVLSYQNAYTQIRSNFRILDSLISLATTDICNSLIADKINKTNIDFTPHSATWLIKQTLVKTAEKFGITLKSNNKQLTTTEISIKHCFVKYQPISNSDDSLTRICSVDISGITNLPNGTIKSLKINKYTFTDKVSKDNLVNISDTQYDFLNPIIPIKQKSFFEKITEPLIIVTSAVLVVVLFFTVRSG